MNRAMFLFLVSFVIFFTLFPSRVSSQELTPWQTGLVDGLDTLGLDTGDLLFTQSMTFDGVMTQFGTCSPFTHSAMIVRDTSDILWLLHATHNDYHGHRMPVWNEETGRSGVIISRIVDMFNSTDGGESGCYKHIWIRKLKTNRTLRPERDTLFSIYQKYREFPFETSNWQFILSAFDLKLFGKDVLLAKTDNLIMCSELLTLIFRRTQMPFLSTQTPSEVTPKDIFRVMDEWYEKPIVFGFKEGKYIILK